ncbi:putative 2-hydroxychromene-2-carboxylate isomerase [Aspergillus clavatus NRRL 1]|uniref:Glutathione S-transferase kappa n=1 Tax=Aspergillus clavatus (strain ATCC 1007 / CBS 513.65 / DSM 816 / NCTC 3887 / NRRL 1 / QM 1276 / 107) TaxID=344612 RepID=A1CH99_ASPCL|nr:2-hydroxychromene-2-carboxylate isomerase, putative [Aspergillus clavatus NRRL 1]EAW10254.1 2-hydroxychromene-2-carboxylate isomerase, putative [Aspergillus clavatus NRRL 1]
MAAPKITLYFDIVSPFGYIAFHVLRNSAAFSLCNINYVPIFLGGLMKACDNTPPISIKNKAQWINRERRRWAHYFSVPIVERTPEGFPPLTLTVQRALCAVSQQTPNKLIPTIEALYHSFWVNGNAKIGQPEGFGPVLEKVLGREGAEEVLQAVNDQKVKALLTANTEQAFEGGAFGLPWFECTNGKGETESFFGVDHIGQVVDFLGLNRRLEKGPRAQL